MKIKIAIFSLLVLAYTLPAQETLDITFDHLCLYHGEEWPSEIYQFPSNPNVEVLKDEILKNNLIEQNFEFISANVPTISVALQDGKYYILYSRRFFKNADRATQLAMLAHAIGHVVNGHTFTESSQIPGEYDSFDCHLPSAQEEMEADEWAGYGLCRAGVPEELVEKIPNEYPLFSHQINQNGTSEDRRSDLLRGFKRAETSLKTAAHASFYEQNPEEVLKNFPKFPFPAPKPSARTEISEYFERCVTLSDVNNKLCRSLDGAGYKTRVFKYAPDGFAVVSAMEQFNKDGSCKTTNRWNSKISRCEGFSPICYLNSIVTTEPACFRVFVFIVTPHVLTATSPPPKKHEAGFWLDEGASKLPNLIGNLPYKQNGEASSVTALVYEFLIPESNRKPIESTPSIIDGNTHLEKAQILSFLRQ
jgi:hypothetical protein